MSCCFVQPRALPVVRYKLERRQRDSYIEKRRNVKASSLSACSSSMQIDHRDTVVINGFLLFPPGSSHQKHTGWNASQLLLFFFHPSTFRPKQWVLLPVLFHLLLSVVMSKSSAASRASIRELFTLKGPHLTSAYRSGYIVFYKSPLFK